MRLIDANALMKRPPDIHDAYDESGDYDYAHGYTINAIKTAPAVDAMPVVRCKDCANYAGDGMYCAWGLLTGDMGYCHHGYVADRAAATEETGADGDRKGGDGLTKGGIIVDDDLKHISTTIKGEVDRKNPRTEIEVISEE